MRAMATGNAREFRQAILDNALYRKQCERYARKLLRALDDLRERDPDLYAALAVPQELRDRIFLETTADTIPHQSSWLA